MTVSDVIWLSAPGFDHYEVSSDGRVRSCDRLTTASGKTEGRVRFFPGQERKTFLVKGYPHLMLNIDGRKINTYVHTLVCEAFHGPRPSPDHEVRHLNGIPTDNRADNLAWGTKSDNAQDSIQHGTNRELNKSHCQNGHPLTGDNVLTFPSRPNARTCRECRRVQRQRYRHKLARGRRG